MTIPDVIHFIWEFLKGEKGGRIEASIVAGLIGLFLSGYFKKKRLRLAIRTEIKIMMASYTEKFTDNNKADLIASIKADPNYRVLFLTSPRRTIIGNLDDDVSYLDADTIENLIAFNDIAELIDDTVRVMRSETFASLSEGRKIATLRVPFGLQKELEPLARSLLKDL